MDSDCGFGTNRLGGGAVHKKEWRGTSSQWLSWRPCCLRSPKLCLCVCVPLFLSSSPPPPPSLILSILFGSQFWLDLQTRTLPSPGVFLPSDQSTPGPHSLPLPALLFNSFRLLLRHYCIYYFCCPGDGNSSSGERRTHCWISLTFLPGSSGVGVGSWPGGGAGAGYFFAHTPTPQCQTFRVSVRLPSCIQSHGGGGCPQPISQVGKQRLGLLLTRWERWEQVRSGLLTPSQDNAPVPRYWGPNVTLPPPFLCSITYGGCEQVSSSLQMRQFYGL